MGTTIAKYRDDPDLQNLIDFSQRFVSIRKNSKKIQNFQNS